MNTSYVTARHVRQLRDQLSSKDHELLRTLAIVRMASAKQLERIHFADVPSAERQCRRNLTRLVQLGVIARIDRTTGGRGGGSDSYTYALDVAGQRLAFVDGPAYGQRPRTPWLPSPPFLRHVSAVAELYVRLVEAQRDGGRELIQYNAEPLCWRFFRSPDGGRDVNKPDAFIRLGCGAEFEDAWFIEVDLATEHRPALERKLATYADHWLSGEEQNKFGAYPQVLWTVPDDARRQVIQQLIDQQPQALRRVHLVYRYDDAITVMQEDTHDPA